MTKTATNRFDWILRTAFGLLTVAFIVLAATNEAFSDWIWARHHNMLSWYIRPLFLIPFCFFAYRRSWAGVLGTVFALATSMFWFPKPEAVGEQVTQFLEMEQQYLFGEWGPLKVLMSLLVPGTLFALAAAFWKRSLWLGLSVLVFIAVSKMTWSVAFGGESGKSIFAPALIGLLICVGLVYAGFRKLDAKRPAA